jgi:ATP-dependent Clp protease protease subunit
MYLTPIVLEQSGHGERSYDIYSRLLKDRIILIFGEINDAVSASVIAQLLYLSSIDEKKDIYIYIHSPGGSVASGLAIYDTMNYISPDCVTIGMGLCASMGAFLLSCGTKGKRYLLPHTSVMIHQPLGGAQGQATDIRIMADEIIKTKAMLNSILAKNTSQPLDKIIQDTERDFYMSSDEAREYGLIDKVITKVQ